MSESIRKIESNQSLSLSEAFDIYHECSRLLFKNPIQGQELLIYILNFKEKFPDQLKDILTDLVEAYGFYPYLEKEKLELPSLASNIRKYNNKSLNLANKFLHDEQKNILNLIFSGKNIVLSAPTSFGKSLLIEEIIASNKYNNIVVIQPTLALLDETRKKLQKYIKNYHIIIKTDQEPKKNKNIFLFTAERVTEYVFFINLKVDFLIIDEFYKLSMQRDDGRAAALNNAFLKMLKHNCQFYLLGPNIQGISDGFADKYDAIFIHTDTNLVVPKTHDTYKKFLNLKPKDKQISAKENELFRLLSEQLKGEPTIVYCSSPAKAYKLMRKYIAFRSEKGMPKKKSQYNNEIIEWIRINISKDWGLISGLEYGLGIHDGSMPKHISTSIINSFNKFELNVIFCTSTIIEGVNTVAKNIVYFDNRKGKVKIDFFDYSNIKGRAGRLMCHYIGHIFNFNEPPREENIIIDIPFYEQKNIQKEILINIDDSEIRDKNSNQYIFLNNLSINERKLFAKNSINIDGQYNILQELRKLTPAKSQVIFWHDLPTSEQLSFSINLIWKFLFDKIDQSFFRQREDKLFAMLSIYIRERNIINLINRDIKFNREQTEKLQKSLDEIIIDNFKFLRTYIQFKLPKFFSILNEIQKFVALENNLQAGDYTQYIKIMENDFIQENLVILSEFGIPKTALIKLGEYIPKTWTYDDISKEIILNKIYKNEKYKLIQYEITKFDEFINDIKD